MIEHDSEPQANALRRALAASTGWAQRTRTPTLAAIERAQGARLWTVDGRRLIDFASGVLVANLGHRHKEFERRYRRLCAKLPRTSYNMLTPVEVDAARRLLDTMADNPNAQKVLWAATGAEAVQKALWAALRRDPGRTRILATRGGFHGKKGLAGEVSGEDTSNQNVHFIDFPRDDVLSEDAVLAQLDQLADRFPNQIALLITEPYLGAAGSYHPQHWYHRALQHWCNHHGVAFIFDEVQSCFGRTGRMYAYQTYGVTPDLVVLGKGLANGEPAAAVVGRADCIDSLDYGEASDTFSGNPRACAAVCATLDIFERESIVEAMRPAAQRLHELLHDLKGRFQFIRAVRGEGMVFGIEMDSGDIANRCILEAYRARTKRGVHFLGPLAEKVLRVSPPLTIPLDDLDDAHRLLRKGWSRI